MGRGVSRVGLIGYSKVLNAAVKARHDAEVLSGGSPRSPLASVAALGVPAGSLLEGC